MIIRAFQTARSGFARAVAVLGLIAAPSFALAGPQFIDESGYAVSGYDVVAYRSLTQSAVGDAQPQAVPGKAEFTAEYNGATWAFASAENRDAFAADPAKYAPAYDGYCAYGVSQGGKVQANPHLWRIVGDTLYLNINKPVVGFWEADIDGHISQANSNWSSLEPQTSNAQGKNAPKFDSSQAPQG